MNKKLLVLSVILFAVVGLVNFAAAEELTGEEVLDRVEASSNPETAQIDFKMTLYSAGGSTREREIKVWRKEGAVNKRLIRFLAPPAVEGTGFLSHDDGADEDMYLYMPAVGSVRRIAAHQQNNNFVGTDFTYNDLLVLGGGYRDNYQAALLEATEEEYLLRLVPKDEEIDYSFARMRVNKNNWFPAEVEFYDQDEKLLKVLTNESVVEIDEYWMAEKITMANKQEGTKTVLEMKEIIYDEPLDDQLFTTRYLERY